MEKILLVGNPNTGKTTLFNSLTASEEHVGNWHGVTVNVKTKPYIFNSKSTEVSDLPGLYSFSTQSGEEQIALNEILDLNDKGLVVNILDVNNLYKNLYLALQLLEMAKPVVLAVNMINEINPDESKNLLANLQQRLNVNVFGIDARDDQTKLKNKLDMLKVNRTYNLPYLKRLPLNALRGITDKYAKNIFDKNWCAVSVIENLDFSIKLLGISEEDARRIKNIITPLGDTAELMANLRFSFIDSMIGKVKNKGLAKPDKLFFNNFLALPVFIGIFVFIFWLTFGVIGRTLSSSLNYFLVDIVGDFLTDKASEIIGIAWFVDFIEEVFVKGMGIVLSFLPQTIILLFSISLLEDTGYLSRVAFMFDGALKKIGLTGKSVFSLLLGFGCTTSALLITRNLESEALKRKTALVMPFMSCSAKLPIFVAVSSVFFFKNKIFMGLLMYFIGVLFTLVFSVIFNKTIIKVKHSRFVMEVPVLRIPRFKKMLKEVLSNIKTFVIRVVSVIMIFSVILWVLKSFSFRFEYIGGTNIKSIIQVVSETIAPVFSPLGFGTWAFVVILLSGLTAKEMIVYSIVLFGGVNALALESSLIYLTPVASFSFLLFVLLYSPCMPALAIMKKEIGSGWAVFSAVFQTVLAYLVSLIFYQTATHLKVNIILIILFFITLAIFLMIMLKYYKRKKCHGCSGACEELRRNNGNVYCFGGKEQTCKDSGKTIS